MWDGPGRTDPSLRRALGRGEAPPELRALVDQVRQQAWTVTDEDVAALAGRYDHDERFEILVATSVGAADERLRSALGALEEA